LRLAAVIGTVHQIALADDANELAAVVDDGNGADPVAPAPTRPAELSYREALSRILAQSQFGSVDLLIIDLASGLDRLYALASMMTLDGVLLLTHPSAQDTNAARHASFKRPTTAGFAPAASKRWAAYRFWSGVTFTCSTRSTNSPTIGSSQLDFSTCMPTKSANVIKSRAAQSCHSQRTMFPMALSAHSRSTKLETDSSTGIAVTIPRSTPCDASGFAAVAAKPGNSAARHDCRGTEHGVEGRAVVRGAELPKHAETDA